MSIGKREEYEDEQFCMQLLQEYLDDSDPSKNDGISLEELAKELGIKLN
ncbi:MAG: hypothetical protein KH020_18805 [Clostridiales bacterium]|nr:hypothetical protein [Clostridiales bacterium]